MRPTAPTGQTTAFLNLDPQMMRTFRGPGPVLETIHDTDGSPRTGRPSGCRALIQGLFSAAERLSNVVMYQLFAAYRQRQCAEIRAHSEPPQPDALQVLPYGETNTI